MCEYFRVSFCILRTTFKKPTISGKIVGVFSFCWRNAAASTETFTEKKLGRKCTLHFTFYLSIALSKILPYSKTVKNTKKTTLAVYQTFYKLVFFETLIMLLEPTTKLITEIQKYLICKSNINFYQDVTGVFSRRFVFSKKTPPFMFLSNYTC